MKSFDLGDRVFVRLTSTISLIGELVVLGSYCLIELDAASARVVGDTHYRTTVNALTHYRPLR